MDCVEVEFEVDCVSVGDVLVGEGGVGIIL